MRALVLRKVKAAFHFTCSHLVALTLAATAVVNLVRAWMHKRHQRRGWLSLIEPCCLSTSVPKRCSACAGWVVLLRRRPW